MDTPVSAGLQELITKDEAYAKRYEDAVRTVRTSRFTELKEAFQHELNSWKNRKHFAKKNGVEWAPEMEGFPAFLIVVGPIPHEGWTLDRIDPRGGYVPENLRWAGKDVQSQNRTNARSIVINGVATTIRSIARAAGKTYDAVRMALKRRGIGHAQLLLAHASTGEIEREEDQWPFPKDYRPALEEEFARDRRPGENRLCFFIRLTHSGLLELEHRHTCAAYSWNQQRVEEIEADLHIVRDLHDKAVEALETLRTRDRDRIKYRHVQAPPCKWRIDDDDPEYLDFLRRQERHFE